MTNLNLAGCVVNIGPINWKATWQHDVQPRSAQDDPDAGPTDTDYIIVLDPESLQSIGGR